MEQVECLVVGAGVVGLAVARRLAAAGLEVVVLEAANAIGTGISSRNSEVIHGGMYYPSGSLRARLCVAGRRALYHYCASRGIPHRQLGKLIVATEPAHQARLAAIEHQGRINGVTDLVRLDAAHVRALEPDIFCVSALYAPATGIIDSHAYLLALQGEAESHGAVVAFNKCELGVADEAAAELAGYTALGYPVVRCSTRGEPGIGALVAHLAGATSVLVGQSGTGKSSLLNALAPEARAITQEISVATEEGRHTTTHAALHLLSGGGALIDSPGVRDYAPPLPQIRDIGSGFVEIASIAAGCRFQDCLHDAEPGCAVRGALASGEIRRRRYDSYRRLLALGRDFDARFPERRRPPARVR